MEGKVYVVISDHFGNLPMGIFSSISEAKELVQTLTGKNHHGCILTYNMGSTYFIHSKDPENVFDNGIN